MEYYHQDKFPKFKKLQCDVFKRFGRDSRTPGEVSTPEGPNPSVDTARRRLREADLFGRRNVTKPLISIKKRKASLELARALKKWTVQQWRKFI
ncbi:transposase [Teladorsagia circumcincta]|uniref:Transposase n=1 Tax=Teladorsagia circumcincta TaxID=45464 RepID=A0A2G9V1I3_TELCI|nr:transposase [Teladorsagia circumcincta]